MVAVVIGVDPHKRSNTALVLDPNENVLARQRFANDRDGYRELKRFARCGVLDRGAAQRVGRAWAQAWQGVVRQVTDGEQAVPSRLK